MRKALLSKAMACERVVPRKRSIDLHKAWDTYLKTFGRYLWHGCTSLSILVLCVLGAHYGITVL